MARVTVHFTRCVQDSQEFGSTNEHMVSRVFFTIESKGKRMDGCYVDLKQTAGADYLIGPIEVAPPRTSDGKQYRGPWNHNEFRKEATAYYRTCVSTLISADPGAKVRMYDNVIAIPRKITFESEGPAGTW